MESTTVMLTFAAMFIILFWNIYCLCKNKKIYYIFMFYSFIRLSDRENVVALTSPVQQ